MAEGQRQMAARQLEMQQQMRERMLATQIAASRDLFRFFGSFYALAVVGLTAGAIKRKTPALLAPLVPLSFVCAFQYDMACNGKIDRIVTDADHILVHEPHLLRMPGGPLTVAAVDAALAARSVAGSGLGVGTVKGVAPPPAPILRK